MLDADHCYERLARRDRADEGAFVVGVTSTGIFCRPGCPARLPLRRNVRFFPTTAEAMSAGFRPCRRCRPLAPLADVGLATVEAICRHIEDHVADALPLEELARRAGYSEAHFQRRFTALVGLSPRDYHAAVRARRYRGALRAATTATAALHDAGYGSTSRVVGAAGPLGPVTPTQYRRGGEGLDLAWTTLATRHGPLVVAASDRGVAFVCFGTHAEAELRAEFPRARLAVATPGEAPLAAWAAALAGHLDARGPDPRLPLDIQGTVFQRLVWSYLTSIPRGATRTYTDVAAAVGRPQAVRAAAGACALNNVSLLIPCHRVIRGDGGLGGYRGGVEVKRALLQSERDTD